jgi:uncharacterized phage infection (PIP) family protein YhgE
MCEEFHPENAKNPKWELVDFLKSKGINVSLVRDTDMLYIDTGGETAITVTVMNPEEDAETGYSVDDEVDKLASTANSGVKGLAARALGTAPQKAKASVKKRQKLAKQAVDVYDQGTKRLEQSLKQSKLSNKPTNTINVGSRY